MRLEPRSMGVNHYTMSPLSEKQEEFSNKNSSRDSQWSSPSGGWWSLCEDRSIDWDAWIIQGFITISNLLFRLILHRVCQTLSRCLVRSCWLAWKRVHSQEGGPLVPGCGSRGFASELSSYLCQGWIRGRQASKHSSQLQSNPQIHALDWLLAWEEEGRRHLQGDSRITWGQPWAPALELWPQEQAGQLASVSIWIKMLVLFCLPGLTLPASRAVHSSVWRGD